MNQRTALAISAAVTAFVLVLVGAVVASVSDHSADATAPSNNQVPTAGQTLSTPPRADTEALRPSPQTVNAAPNVITPDQAASAVLSFAPRATLTRQPELVSFDGTTAYEVLLDSGNVYVDAQSGQVLYSTIRSGDGRSRFARAGHESHEAHEADDDD